MADKRSEDRQRAVQRYCAGESPSSICVSMGYSRPWLYKWLHRFLKGSGDWFGEQSRRPHQSPTRSGREIEQIVILTRLSLYNRGLFCGAQAIRWELEDLAVTPRPSLRTINRLLARNELTHRRTGRYQPKGKRYPILVASQPGDVHQADFVGPCYLTGPVRFYSLHSVDLATGRCAVEPLVQRAGQATVDALWAAWTRLGMPQHQQVDNEMVFYGSPAHPRGMGVLIRLCLPLGDRTLVYSGWRAVAQWGGREIQRSLAAEVPGPYADGLGGGYSNRRACSSRAATQQPLPLQQLILKTRSGCGGMATCGGETGVWDMASWGMTWRKLLNRLQVKMTEWENRVGGGIVRCHLAL